MLFTRTRPRDTAGPFFRVSYPRHGGPFFCVSYTRHREGTFLPCLETETQVLKVPWDLVYETRENLSSVSRNRDTGAQGTLGSRMSLLRYIMMSRHIFDRTKHMAGLKTPAGVKNVSEFV